MPRTARKKSESQIYHIMLRGINKQNIFEEAEDYKKMLELLQYCVEKSGVEIYAYCLMTNHIHLLLKEGNEPLGITFRRLGSKFVYWYNTKYQRTGHLFQDRFRSEAVEDDSYFATVLRYIHLNPVQGGLVKNASDYLYSSYNGYLNNNAWFNTAKAFTILPKKNFVAFHQEKNDDKCMDIIEEQQPHLTEEKAKEVMHRVTKCLSSSEFQALEKEKKKDYIRVMKKKGLSIRQISRLTGESYYIIQKI